jgi:hypothetical protein
MFLLVCVLILGSLATTLRAEMDVRGLYEQKCGRCHLAYEPGVFSPELWPGLLASMRDDANLDDAEQSLLLGWLVENSVAQRADRNGQQAKPAEGAIQARLGGYFYSEYQRTPERVSNFDLHYLAISLEGWPRPQLHYLAEFEFEHGGKGDNTFVEQAWLEVWPYRSLMFRVGALLLPFNRFDDFHEPHLNPFVSRPLSAREVTGSAWKEVGLQLHGQHSVNPILTAAVDVFAVNGLGDGSTLRNSRQYRDNNENLTTGFRAHVLIHDRLEMGISFANGPWDDESTLDLTHSGAHLLCRLPWFNVHSEFARARSGNPDGIQEGISDGWFASLSRTWNPVLQTSIRMGALEIDEPGWW